MTTWLIPRSLLALAAALALTSLPALAEEQPLGPFGRDHLLDMIKQLEAQATAAEQAFAAQTKALQEALAQCQSALKPLGSPPQALKPPREIEPECPQCPAMVELPQGAFMMGSPKHEPERSNDEGPQHKVTIGYRLAVSKYEVTRAEFARFAKNVPTFQTDAEKSTAAETPKGCWIASQKKFAQDSDWRKPGFAQTDENPVVCVSWNDAQAYIAWLNSQPKLKDRPPSQQYRLLSEAEWEYAARAGADTPFSMGACINAKRANYDSRVDYNQCDATTHRSLQQTQPVGRYPANPWHLYDMSGNVWDWVQDCYHGNYNGAPTDGSAWNSCTDDAGNTRAIRGGSWDSYPRNLRSAARNRYGAGDPYNYIGFRIARTLAP